MSKIVQFSTIGALMAGHFRGECCLEDINHPRAFGVGCSAELNGELTIAEGQFWEATAGTALHNLDQQSKVPFIQLTEFIPQRAVDVENISQLNAEQLLEQQIDKQNVFVAVCIEATFEEMIIRRPQPNNGKQRGITEVAGAQQVDTHHNIQGRLIGFWTPELFGRVSVPGFHFHFLNYASDISGHVLEYRASRAQLSFEEKPTIEITNPTSQSYKELIIDVAKLDRLISQVEK